MYANNTPTGSFTVAIYAHNTGSFGGNGIPTGSALVSSSNYDPSTIPDIFNKTDLWFPLIGWTPEPSTPYFLVLDGTNSITDASNVIQWVVDSGAPTSQPGHPGNTALRQVSGVWNASSTTPGFQADQVFSLYETSPDSTSYLDNFYPNDDIYVWNIGNGYVGSHIKPNSFKITIDGISNYIQDDGSSNLRLNGTGSIVGNVFYDHGIAVVKKGDILISTSDNLLRNPNFDDASVWSQGSGWSIGSGVATHTTTLAGDLSQVPTEALVPLQEYEVTYDIINRTVGGVFFKIGNPFTPTPNTGSGTANVSDGTYTETVIASTSGTTVGFRSTGSFEGDVDNVSLTTSVSSSNISEDGIAILSGSQVNTTFQSSVTIYEHNVTCVLTPMDCTTTVNPTAFQTSSQGTTYNNGILSGSGEVPYVKTVGLFNDYNELLAVAKVSAPITRQKHTDQTFLIKFDE
jgi:hypothetical protein